MELSRRRNRLRLGCVRQPGLRADLFAYLANVCRLQGRLKQSARATEQALRLDAASGSLDTQGQAFLNRARLALVRLEPTAALAAFRLVLRYAEEQQSPYYQVAAWAGLAQSHTSLGSLDAAAQALQRARAIHGRVGERPLDLQLSIIEGRWIREEAMDETGSAFGTEDLELHERQNSAADSGRRLLRRPTPAETEQIARDCPPDGLSVPVIVDAIRRATGCSRATAYRAVTDAFAAGVLGRRTKARETTGG
jgi:tetratricopeptide (TPR) repeat protein